MAKPGRPKQIERKTTLSIVPNLSAWLEFRGRNYSRGTSEYLCELAARDRENVLESDGEVAEKYKLFCVATGNEAELESLGL